MKILIIGDIYGYEGKELIKAHLPKIKQKLKPDLTIANGENVSFGGKSLIKSDYDEILHAGVDFFTMGNHTFRKEEINDYIDDVNNLVRPANWVGNVKGKGYITFELNGKKILLINLLGEIFMNIKVENPFIAADKILDNINYDISIMDFHAEATSEKIVLGNYLSDKLTIFYGTHTHIQTSDERIMNNNMAYITDVGMSGVFNSAIGADFKQVTNRLKNNARVAFKEASGGDLVFNAIVVTVSDSTNKVTKIERISEIFTQKK